MNNQFCKQCGQANFPEARVCTKCGTGLGGQFGQQPIQQFAGASGKSQQKSNKVFWIVGGVAVFVIFALGGLGILAAIGGYVYFQSKEHRVERKYPAPPPRRDQRPEDQPLEDQSPGDLSNSKLIDYMKRNRSRVGNYRLDNVKEFKGQDFRNRSAGVTALFTNGSKRVVHSIAMFKSPATALSDFSRYKRAIRNMKGSRVRSSTSSQVVYSYKGSIFLTFCNDAGGCHELISKNGKYILEYSDSYFEKSNYKPSFK